MGQNSRQPEKGCSHNGRRAAVWSRGPACGDATAQARMCPAYDRAPMSRSGVASNDEAVGTCSALRGTLCRAACSCAPASVSRSVVRDGAQGGVFGRQWYGASAAAPANGASEGGRGAPFGDLTPETCMGSALTRRAHDRLHGHIPQAGPGSALRRSLRLTSRSRRDMSCATLRVINPFWLQRTRGSLCYRL